MDPKNELTIAHYRMKLRIEPSEIDRELIEQPQNYFDVAEEAARAQSRVAEAKEQLAVVEASLYPICLRKLKEAGDSTNEASIKSAVARHGKRLLASDRLRDATLEAAEWAAMRDAMSSRGYMLRDLCQLTLAGHFATVSVKGPATDAKADRVKQDLKKKRDDSWKKDVL